MENITLAAYLEKNPDSKRLNKRFTRALKILMHASKDLGHASCDLAHAKEDCTFALHAAEQQIEACQEILNGWALPQEEKPAPDIELEKDEECCEFEEGESCPSRSLKSHLRHAVKDIGRALHEAQSAVNCLSGADELILDISDMARKEGFDVSALEAKSFLMQKAREALDAEASAAGEKEASA